MFDAGLISMRLTVLAVVFAVAASSCGGSASDTERAEPPIWLPDHVAEELSPIYVAELRERIARVGGVQAEILADGVVTTAELERAALAVLACVEDRGVEVVDFYFDRGSMGITYSHVGVPADPVSREDAIYEQCVAENYDLVAEVRGLQRWPTEEERQRAHEALRACMRDRGIEDDFTEDLEFIGSDPASLGILRECRQSLREQMSCDD